MKEGEIYVFDQIWKGLELHCCVGLVKRAHLSLPLSAFAASHERNSMEGTGYHAVAAAQAFL